MENENKVPSKIIEIETSIKLLEYLKRNNTIDDGMYNFCINKLLHKIEIDLNDEGNGIVRLGRNAENHHVPKNATVEEYSYATAFEALIGYLYLTKQDERLKEILQMCIQ